MKSSNLKKALDETSLELKQRLTETLNGENSSVFYLRDLIQRRAVLKDLYIEELESKIETLKAS